MGDPNNPDVLHLMAAIVSQGGDVDQAVELMKKAVEIRPDYIDAHGNLGQMLMSLGRQEEAVGHFQKILELEPNYIEAHGDLGNALAGLGRFDEAMVHFQKIVEAQPEIFQAHTNMGNVLMVLGRAEEAIKHYHKVTEIVPENPAGHVMLGDVYRQVERLDEAIECYRKAIEVEPFNFEGHYNLGTAYMGLGRYDEAQAEFNAGIEINHGGPWWGAATFGDGEGAFASMAPPAGTPTVSAFKLSDTADQLEYLINKGKIDPSFDRMVRRYRSVVNEIHQDKGVDAVTELTPDQFGRIATFFNRVVHIGESSAIEGETVNPDLDFKKIEDSYLSSPVQVTTFDDFLTPTALKALRDYCTESTFFFDYLGPGYVGSRISCGFNHDLLYQIVEDLRERFPRVIADHELSNMWVYRHRNQCDGVRAHTDEGAVTFNFWITPDEANLNPDGSGLTVYTKEQPLDWDWQRYNEMKHTPEVKQEIDDFLADADTVTMPYRENRALLFHSNLFHKSEPINFKDGFENRRINITLLFGRREA
jgi:tetratricopeptide (TPR) repeat protein